MSFLWKKCTHEKLSALAKSGYCPDCGKYVENHWYVARCKCCGIRHKTIIRNGKAIVINKFCKNCGSEDYYIEEIESPDIVSINYAALQKTVINVSTYSIVQSWIEKQVQNNYGYLPVYQ